MLRSNKENDDMTVINQKPPIGVTPEKLYEEERIQELSRAVAAYICIGKYNEQLVIWIKELTEHLSAVISRCECVIESNTYDIKSCSECNDIANELFSKIKREQLKAEEYVNETK